MERGASSWPRETWPDTARCGAQKKKKRGSTERLQTLDNTNHAQIFQRKHLFQTTVFRQIDTKLTEEI